MSSEKRIEKFKKERVDYEKDLAEIVIKTNRIESLIENLILAELRPDRLNYEFMKDVLFNSVCISLGAKVNLVKNVSVRHQWKWKKGTME